MSSFADKAVAAVRAKFGGESARLLSDGGLSNVTEVIPTGIDVLDNYILGIGGLPVGRLIEIFSDEGAGKTSLLLQFVAAVQREGGIAMLAETENALQDDRAAMFGADLSQVVMLGAECVEDFFGYSEAAITALPKSAGPVLLGWDSIAATPTRSEVDNGLTGDARVAEKARIMSQKVPLLVKMAREHRVTSVFVNQIRQKIGVMFGDNSTTPGGNAVKFYATVRLRIYAGKATKDGTEHTGKDPTICSVKNKVGYPWRKAKVRLNYDKGWDTVWSTINHAKDKKLIGPRTRVSAKAHIEALSKLGWSQDNAKAGDSHSRLGEEN